MHVVGTAGHVDHGKSTLVQALTGIDPDRLKEEKERQMTIDLGFAWMTGEGQEEIGIVDVPGHRDFIENMLAGVGGIDLALLVIAADEGVMPQTSEHLAILNLMQIKGGIVALTKVDLIEDPDWLELVILDVSEVLTGTVLENAPILPVSAVTGFGIGELRSEINEQLKKIEPKKNIKQPRLPIDRVFSLSGFGTVVTGTLTGGQLKVGDAVEVQPIGSKGRIRGLQTHRTKRQVAEPGSRVAVNLTGIPKEEIMRGHVLTSPGLLSATILCDVEYEHLPHASLPLKHNEEVKFFTGSTEVLARTRVLGSKQIDPGKMGWLQLVLREPVAMTRGDRFILRRPSPPATIGGGVILDPYPGRRHKRFRANVIAKFEILARGSSVDLLEYTLTREEPVLPTHLTTNSGLEPDAAWKALEQLIQEKRAVMVGDYLMSSGGWRKLIIKLVETLDAFHKDAPLRIGMAREELRSRLKLPAVVFNALLEQASASNSIVDAGRTIRLRDHKVSFNAAQQEAITLLMTRFKESGANSPSVKDARTQVGDAVYLALLDTGKIVQISDDVVYAKSDYETILAQIRTYLSENGQVNAAKVRDLLQTSRKYAIALLEHLDDIHVTKRVGDYRKLVE